jgi:hypothetical protein
MDAEKRPGPRRDFGVIQEDKRLDQLANVGGANESRDRPVTATAGRKRNSARAGLHRRFDSILDVRTKGGTGCRCGCDAHFHLHE